jgi:hypothetical protein
VVELLPVSPPAPVVVIPVLLTSAVVDPSGLDVAARVGADPHVLPGRRNDEGTDAVEGVTVGDPLSAGVDVDKALARASAPDARRVAVRPP